MSAVRGDNVARPPTAAVVKARSLRQLLGAERTAALSTSIRVFVTSRVFVFACGVFAFLTFQPQRAPDTVKFDVPYLTHPFGGFLDVVLSPSARWDSVWYLGIAEAGYHGNEYQPAFFPLYPLLARIGGLAVGGFRATPESIYLGGLALSLLAFGGSLYLLYRLVSLELGERFARPALLLVAFFPMAMFFSAIYSESLFLFTSLGAFYMARTGRWAAAAAFAALAGATRNAGVLLLVPLIVVYLWGPRTDRPARPGSRSRWAALASPHQLRPDFLWLLLVPVGLAAYMAYLWVDLGDPFAFVDAQRFWLREFLTPLGGIYEGGSAAFQGVRQLLHGARTPVYWTASQGDPFRVAALNIELFLFMVAALVATVGALRRLPAAYGAYAAIALAMPLAYPVRTIPLMSLPRFVAVIFPLFVWLALFVEERRWTEQAVAVSAVLLGLFTAQWATWQWVS